MRETQQDKRRHNNRIRALLSAQLLMLQLYLVNNNHRREGEKERRKEGNKGRKEHMNIFLEDYMQKRTAPKNVVFALQQLPCGDWLQELVLVDIRHAKVDKGRLTTENCRKLRRRHELDAAEPPKSVPRKLYLSNAEPDKRRLANKKSVS